MRIPIREKHIFANLQSLRSFQLAKSPFRSHSLHSSLYPREVSRAKYIQYCITAPNECYTYGVAYPPSAHCIQTIVVIFCRASGHNCVPRGSTRRTYRSRFHRDVDMSGPLIANLPVMKPVPLSIATLACSRPLRATRIESAPKSPSGPHGPVGISSSKRIHRRIASAAIITRAPWICCFCACFIFLFGWGLASGVG